MTLRVTEDNPLPEGIISGYLTAKKGLKLRYALLSREEPGPGTVVLLQGRCEAIEKYFETIGDLRAMGFDCATLDWRGQGGSDRMLRDRMAAHVRSFDHYVEDLTLFFNEVVLQSCRPPYFILAHSMGGLVTLLALPQLAQHVRRAVLLAFAGAIVARCGGPERYFTYLDVLFAQQRQWATAQDPMGALKQIARLGGMSSEQVDTCFADKTLGDYILNQRLEGNQKFNVNSTPTLIINGKTEPGVPSWEELRNKLNALAK